MQVVLFLSWYFDKNLCPLALTPIGFQIIWNHRYDLCKYVGLGLVWLG